MDFESTAPFRAARNGFRWDGVAHQPYKQDGSAPFKDISRQVLFHEPDLGCEMRYFEMEVGGYSTLERHQHAHAVMILRGSGDCLVGQDVRPVKQFDLISIPSMAWHQFRATQNEPLGFLCMVNKDRDRPQLPTDADLSGLASVPEIAKFLQG